jgi:hypothetical protein
MNRVPAMIVTKFDAGEHSQAVLTKPFQLSNALNVNRMVVSDYNCADLDGQQRINDVPICDIAAFVVVGTWRVEMQVPSMPIRTCRRVRHTQLSIMKESRQGVREREKTNWIELEAPIFASLLAWLRRY